MAIAAFAALVSRAVRRLAGWDDDPVVLTPERVWEDPLWRQRTGLTGEAVEELSQAARDPKLALDSFSAIGQAYLHKRDFEEAEKWLRKALAAAREGSEQYYALVYELAGVVEGAEDRDKAVSLLREVRTWNPGYRDVAARLEGLEKAAAD